MAQRTSSLENVATVARALALRLSPIVVLALLAGITTPRLDRRDADRVERAADECRRICAALVAYRNDHGAYPPGLQGDPTYNYANGTAYGFGAEILNTWLLESGRKYLDAPIGLDPWGRAYNYQVFTRSSPCKEVVVFSNGPDRTCDSWDASTWNRDQWNGDDIGACFDGKKR